MAPEAAFVQEGQIVVFPHGRDCCERRQLQRHGVCEALVCNDRHGDSRYALMPQLGQFTTQCPAAPVQSFHKMQAATQQHMSMLADRMLAACRDEHSGTECDEGAE